jgi:hypothetical protein
MEQETELERRLRALKWPDPPPGARVRVLEALSSHLEELTDSVRDRGNGDSPPEREG